MTTPNLDALANQLPVIVSNGQRREMDVLDGDLFFGDDGKRLDPDHIAAALNEWAELRGASPSIRAENARLRYAVHMEVNDAGYTHDNAMADAIRERDVANRKAANKAIDHEATAELLIAAQKELTELRAYRERTEGALARICRQAGNSPTDYEFLTPDDLRDAGLWREPGQGATDGN